MNFVLGMNISRWGFKSLIMVGWRAASICFEHIFLNLFLKGSDYSVWKFSQRFILKTLKVSGKLIKNLIFNPFLAPTIKHNLQMIP